MLFNVKLIFAVSILLTGTSILSYPQETEGRNKINLKLGCSVHESFTSLKKRHIAGRLEFNYSLTDHLETGIYTGYGMYKLLPPGDDWNTNVVFYGLNLNYYISPFIIRKANTNLSIYLSGKYGGYYMFLNGEIPLEKGNRPDYGIYLDVTYYIIKHAGLYFEIGYGNCSFTKAGLAFRL
jgi:hypothetical protein